MIKKYHIIELIAYPGTLLRVITTRFIAEREKLPIHSICYFQKKYPLVEMTYEFPDNLRSAFWITAGPLVVNATVCTLLMFPVIFPYTFLNANVTGWYTFLFGYLGFCCGIAAFPSVEEMLLLTDLAKHSSRRNMVWIARTLTVITWTHTVARGDFAIFFYAILISFLLPIAVWCLS